MSSYLLPNLNHKKLLWRKTKSVGTLVYWHKLLWMVSLQRERTFNTDEMRHHIVTLPLQHTVMPTLLNNILYMACTVYIGMHWSLKCCTNCSITGITCCIYICHVVSWTNKITYTTPPRLTENSTHRWDVRYIARANTTSNTTSTNTPAIVLTWLLELWYIAVATTVALKDIEKITTLPGANAEKQILMIYPRHLLKRLVWTYVAQLNLHTKRNR